MTFKTINSFEDLTANLQQHPHQFLLLYKSLSDNSECAIENLNKADHTEAGFL